MFKLLNDIKNIVKRVRLCNDISPHEDIYRFVRIISHHFNTDDLDKEVRIRFKKPNDGKSKAHNIANKTYKGRRKEDYLIKESDLNDLCAIIEKVKSKDGS